VIGLVIEVADRQLSNDKDKRSKASCRKAIENISIYKMRFCLLVAVIFAFLLVAPALSKPIFGKIQIANLINHLLLCSQNWLCILPDVL
jgi:hypothetical protein